VTENQELSFDHFVNEEGRTYMWKAKVHITLKKSVLDPQGKTIQHALTSLGYDKLKEVRMGKYAELMLDADSQEEAEKQIEEMCERLLANPVIEDWTIEVESA